MNLAPTFLDRIRRDSPSTADELLLLHHAITAGWNREHRPDGTHGTITATGGIAERGRTTAMGATTEVFFSPTNFTANGAMTWTVPAATVFYTLIGTRMVLDFEMSGTTVGGVVNTALLMTIPDGFYAKRRSAALYRLVDNGVLTMGLVLSTVNSNILSFLRNDIAAFTASAAATTLQGQLWFEVGTS